MAEKHLDNDWHTFLAQNEFPGESTAAIKEARGER